MRSKYLVVNKYFISLMIFLIVITMSVIVKGVSSKNSDTTQNQIGELESAKYIISEAEKIIYRVIPQTDVTSFVNNFNTSNQIKVYKDKECSSEITSGYIGTGMVLKDETKGTIYEISTIGDFDGDGEIGQIELTNLIRHVVGLKDYQLDGVLLKSADLNNDKQINIVDITILIRYTVYGELEIPENQEIKSPTIEIVSGTQGNNDWYTSNVSLKITPNIEENLLEKTTYKISGDKSQEETEIDSNQVITLEQGKYSITAYSYGKSGFKSLATRKEINIDTTMPQIGNVNMWLEEKGGTEYTPNTWTSHDVILEIEDGLDNESGHDYTKYYINGEEQKEKTITLTESGVYNIEIETVDKAGNVSSKEEVVKIDKNSILPPKIEVISGTKSEGSDWYNSETVVLQVSNEDVAENSAKIVKNTYTIEGSKEVKETDVNSDGRITITENGVFTITAYSINEAGQKSEGTTITIKKDSTRPGAPVITIVSGTKLEGIEDWYIDNVSLKISKPEESTTSQVTQLVYVIEGAQETKETEIENEGIVTITKEGVSTITAYSINEAGNKSDATTIIIQKDSEAPDLSKISVKDIGTNSFKLVGEAEDKTSGIKTYEFYINDELINTVNTNVKQVEIPIENKPSGIYKAYVIVKDNAGNEKKSNEIEIQTAKLTENEIDHFEFVITGFSITNNNEDVEDAQDAVIATISDTSLTNNSKYIMINSKDPNINGTITGKLRLVCKDGTIVEDFSYFPADLNINMSYYADGSGTTYTHNNEVNFFGVDLNSGNVQDGESVETNIIMSNIDIENNKFTISEENLTGTQTYTRATINSVTLNGEKMNFSVVQEQI